MSQPDKINNAIQELTLEFNLVSDGDAKFRINQKMIALKTELKKLNNEQKSLAAPMQQILPDIFEGKRAIPNPLLRSALFGLVKKGKRALVKDEHIFSMSQYEIMFSGEQLDQNDLEVWDTLIFIAKKNGVDNSLRISMYELCKILKLSPTNTSYEALSKRIQRLQFGQVKITLKNKEYGGSLINDYYVDRDGDGKIVIEYNKKLAQLFIDNDFTYISADIRHLLGDTQLAKWIYNFYESHKDPFPLQIEYLQKLCRSESETKEFKRMLKSALEVVRNAYITVNNQSKWTYEINSSNYLIIYPAGKHTKQLPDNPIKKH